MPEKDHDLVPAEKLHMDVFFLDQLNKTCRRLIIPRETTLKRKNLHSLQCKTLSLTLSLTLFGVFLHLINRHDYHTSIILACLIVFPSTVILYSMIFVEPACGKARHGCYNFCSVYVLHVCVHRTNLSGP